jgi:hypothetical protein
VTCHGCIGIKYTRSCVSVSAPLNVTEIPVFWAPIWRSGVLLLSAWNGVTRIIWGLGSADGQDKRQHREKAQESTNTFEP